MAVLVHVLAMPLGYLYATALEWGIHRYLFHGRGKKRGSLFAFHYVEHHGACPSADVFERHKYTTPNFSLRMSNIQAAIIRPQLRVLDEQCRRWNKRHDVLMQLLRLKEHLFLPERDPREQYVGAFGVVLESSPDFASAHELRRERPGQRLQSAFVAGNEGPAIDANRYRSRDICVV